MRLFQPFLFLIFIINYSNASVGIYPVYPIISHIKPLHRRAAAPKPAECPADFKPCQATGKNISVCCPLSSTCSPHNLSPAGIICCLHPTCSPETPLSCPSKDFFHCSDGGCCPNGTICRDSLCVIDPTATTTTSATPSPVMTPPPKTRKSGEDVPVRGWPSVAVDVDGDGLSGTEDPVEEIPLTSGELDWRTGKVVVTGSVVYETKKPRETRGPPVGQGVLAPGLTMETKAVTKEVVLHDRKKGGAGRVGGEWGVFGVAAVAFGAAVMGGQV